MPSMWWNINQPDTGRDDELCNYSQQRRAPRRETFVTRSGRPSSCSVRVWLLFPLPPHRWPGQRLLGSPTFTRRPSNTRTCGWGEQIGIDAERRPAVQRRAGVYDRLLLTSGSRSTRPDPGMEGEGVTDCAIDDAEQLQAFGTNNTSSSSAPGWWGVNWPKP
jgi:hypothetical protein